MPVEVVMPKLGLNMTEGIVAGWLRKEGDPVRKGEPLFIVETDKVTVEAEAPANGILGRILVAEGETVPVRQVVALLLTEGEESLPAATPVIHREARTASRDEGDRTLTLPASSLAPSDASAREGDREVNASPVARRMARENGINLALVRGTGGEGRVTREDVKRFLAERGVGAGTGSSIEAPGPRLGREQDGIRKVGKPLDVAGVRAVIADRMMKSLHTTAQFTLHSEVDGTALVEFRENLKAQAEAASGRPPSYDAILVHLISMALREHPYLNATQVGNAIHLFDEIHVGVAVDTPGGLFAVVVRNADRKTVQEIEKELGERAERARHGMAMPDDLTGSTFTMTNLGSVGIDGFTPIINPPEAAVLGVGRIAPKLVIQEGKVAQRYRLTLSLTIDHRIVDGAPAARFLQRLAEMMDQLR